MKDLKLIKKQPPLGYYDTLDKISDCNRDIEAGNFCINRRKRLKQDTSKFDTFVAKLEADKKLYQLTLLN